MRGRVRAVQTLLATYCDRRNADAFAVEVLRGGFAQVSLASVAITTSAFS